jgi:hypothetical protein
LIGYLDVYCKQVKRQDVREERDGGGWCRPALLLGRPYRHSNTEQGGGQRRSISMSLATLQKTQIVVSGDSDDEAPKDERLVIHGPTSSPFASNSRAGTNDGDINPLSHKYPHTKSCLLGIVRENRLDGDLENDEFDSLLQQVISTLKEENEDELKSLLKSSFELSEDTVSVTLVCPAVAILLNTCLS